MTTVLIYCCIVTVARLSGNWTPIYVVVISLYSDGVKKWKNRIFIRHLLLYISCIFNIKYSKVRMFSPLSRSLILCCCKGRVKSGVESPTGHSWRGHAMCQKIYTAVIVDLVIQENAYFSCCEIILLTVVISDWQRIRVLGVWRTMRVLIVETLHCSVMLLFQLQCAFLIISSRVALARCHLLLQTM